MILILLLSNFIIFAGNTKTTQITVDSSQKRDSLRIKISAINLSEDLSVLSTKNDELLMLIYELMDSSKLTNPVLLKQMKLDKSHRSKVIYWVGDSLIKTKKHLLVLLEIDSERSIEQIEPSVRVYHKEISDAFQMKNYNVIEKYLGDDDILGFKEFTISEIIENGEIKFIGVNKIDKYEYEIQFESSIP